MLTRRVDHLAMMLLLVLRKRTQHLQSFCAAFLSYSKADFVHQAVHGDHGEMGVHTNHGRPDAR